MSVIRAVGYTMFAIVGLIFGYFILSPVYYTMLDNLDQVLMDNNPSSEAQSWANLAYGTFFFGLSSLVVLGLCVSIYWLYMFVRRKYFATEGYYP